MHQNFLNFVHHEDVLGFEKSLKQAAKAVRYLNVSGKYIYVVYIKIWYDVWTMLFITVLLILILRLRKRGILT